ncbi:MAG: hypothetical protein CM15mP127_05310 [Gammaproteobacteria bacterium]|nr:MAG: hypothetical protein CM15mP127_05310 [Gammaproteobacteria bacterium]
MQSYMEAFSYFLQNNQIFLYISGLSTIFFLLSLLGLSWLISIIPHNYFVDKKRVSLIKMKNPLMWLPIIIIKNSIGLVLILCGILMLILPGQGVLTIITGLIFLDYPGKFRFERSLVRNKLILNSMNWIRRKLNKPDLII